MAGPGRRYMADIIYEYILYFVHATPSLYTPMRRCDISRAGPCPSHLRVNVSESPPSHRVRVTVRVTVYESPSESTCLSQRVRVTVSESQSESPCPSHSPSHRVRVTVSVPPSESPCPCHRPSHRPNQRVRVTVSARVLGHRLPPHPPASWICLPTAAPVMPASESLSAGLSRSHVLSHRPSHRPSQSPRLSTGRVLARQEGVPNGSLRGRTGRLRRHSRPHRPAVGGRRLAPAAGRRGGSA